MIDSNVYSEVYEILSYMDKKTVMKIPIEILIKIKENRNKKYISKINPNNIGVRIDIWTHLMRGCIIELCTPN